MHPNDADKIANSGNTDCIAFWEQSDLGPLCLLRPVCFNIKDHYRWKNGGGDF